jgi:hypothetical protein
MKEFKKELSNGAYALRIGEKVPEGDVNLAFIHTPRIDSDQNISLIQTTSMPDNLIPMDQLESMVVPDSTGKLQYATILSEDQPIILRSPYDMFPSKNVKVTKRFIRNEHTVAAALFYKTEILYHYDSEPGEPGKVVRYKGNQIQLTDENGNVLDSSFKYIVYVQAQAATPPATTSHVFRVWLYLQFNTDEEKTFKVRYNHVDTPVLAADAQAVKKTVELYSNKSNPKVIEGGKLRIINGSGAFDEATLGEVQSASELKEIYAIEERPEVDGYRIYVPQKSRLDPRTAQMFNYKVVAKYKDENGKERVITCGYITDSVIDQSALLDHEKLDYAGDSKILGLRSGASIMDSRSLMNMMIPIDMPSLPPETAYSIEDTEGNLLYTTTQSPDKGSVITEVNPSGSEPARAKSATASNKWEGAMESNVRLKNRPISHRCTIIPERQMIELPFTWEASGEGQIVESTSLQATWGVRQDIHIVHQSTTETGTTLSSWNNIGTVTDKSDWKVVKSSGVEELYLTENQIDLGGFFNPSHRDKKDYMFSANVRVSDKGYDDDVIGIMFRVQDSRNYYAFAWEKDRLNDKVAADGNGMGRILMGYRGVSAVVNNVTVEGYAYEPDWSNYLQFSGSFNHSANDDRVGKRKKKIFKAVPNFMPAYDPNNEPRTKYMSDRTGCSYLDITAYNQLYDDTGWELNKSYKITVVVKSNDFRLYISDVSDSGLGKLVCVGVDTENHPLPAGNPTKNIPAHSQGSYGIFNISQQDCYWSKLTFTELEGQSVASDMFPVTFTSNAEMKLSDKTAADILKPKIDALAKGKKLFEPMEPIQFTASGPIQGRIKNDGYVYGYTNSPQAGGTKITPWRTGDNGLNIKGSGKVQLLPDGTMTGEFTPNEIDAEIPEKVQNFKWRIEKMSGDSSINLSLGSGNKPLANAPVPPITRIGSPYTTELGEIYKHEGIKSIETLDNLLTKLNLPADVPMSEVLLRIERGENENGQNAEYRVNYRFLYNLNGNKRFEVDQINKGVNRIRLRNILKKDSHTEFLDALRVNLIAWTNFEELEAVPVLAIKIDDSHKIDIEKPRVEKKMMERENWYMRIKNGRLKRRLRLPYYEPQEYVPQLYVANPELIAYKPKSAEETVEVVMDYSIPEYTNQEFTNLPIMLKEKESPVVLNEQMIQVQHIPIVLASESGVSYLEVTASRMNSARRLKVSDVDAEKGIIYLIDRIRDQDEVFVRYAYREDWYTYRGFSKNEKRDVIDVGAPVPLSVTYNAQLHAVGKKMVTDPGSGGQFKKALFLHEGLPEYSPSDGFNQFIQVLRAQGMTVDTDTWTDARAAQYHEYDLIIIGYMQQAKGPTVLNAFSSYLADGGSAIVTAEHSGLTDWNDNFRSIISSAFPDLTLVPAGIVTTNGTFNTSHPLTQGCTSFNMTAASFFTISGTRVQPIAYAVGQVVVAAFEQSGQRVVFMTDCNFMDNDRGFTNPGNKKMIENIVSWTAPVETEVTETEDGSLVNQSFTTTLYSAETEKSERVKIASIPLRTGFGTDMKAFIEEYAPLTLTLTPAATTSASSLPLVKFELLYQADGKPVAQRSAAPTDILDLYVTITVPVVTKEESRPLQLFHMDFNPTPGHTFTLAKNSFHRWIPVSETGESFSMVEAPGNELLVRQINIYLRPTGIWLATPTSTELIAGTLRQQSIYHTDEDYWFNPRDRMHDPSMLRLGRVFVQSNSDMQKDMVILDIRSRGGGLDEGLSREIIARINKESLHNWDIGYFDGEAYQENGVIIIRLPRKLLETFSEAQVQAAIAKHKTYGVLPIIEYHDEDPSFTIQEI